MSKTGNALPMPQLLAALFGLVLGLVLSVTPASAFSQRGEDCMKCHTLTEKDLGPILSKLRLADAKVLKVQMSPIKGIWEIAIDNRGQRFVVYMDFSKKFATPGPLLEIDTMTDRTRARVEQLNQDRRINLASIPLGEAMVVGKADAQKKIPVFLDPD